MQYVRRLFDSTPPIYGDVEYAYAKTMPLVQTEMMLRENVDLVGALQKASPHLYSAVLVLPWSSHLLELPDGAKLTVYDAWRQVFTTISDRPGVYVIDNKRPAVKNSMVINCPTSVVVIVVETDGDGAQPVLRRAAPYSSTYEEATAARELPILPVDPRRLSAKSYMSLATSLVSANRTDDARLVRGLVASESMPGSVLEQIKARVFRRLDADK